MPFDIHLFANEHRFELKIGQEHVVVGLLKAKMNETEQEEKKVWCLQLYLDWASHLLGRPLSLCPFPTSGWLCASIESMSLYLYLSPRHNAFSMFDQQDFVTRCNGGHIQIYLSTISGLRSKVHDMNDGQEVSTFAKYLNFRSIVPRWFEHVMKDVLLHAVG